MGLLPEHFVSASSPARGRAGATTAAGPAGSEEVRFAAARIWVSPCGSDANRGFAVGRLPICLFRSRSCGSRGGATRRLRSSSPPPSASSRDGASHGPQVRRRPLCQRRSRRKPLDRLRLGKSGGPWRWIWPLSHRLWFFVGCRTRSCSRSRMAPSCGSCSRIWRRSRRSTSS